MDAQQREDFQEVISLHEKVTQKSDQYWQLYSNFETWPFWVIACMLVVPLVILYFLLDRKHIFVIGFFGFAIHILFAYVNATGIRYGLWNYPYQMVPFLPSLSIDASIIPVTIMLVFQWTFKYQKNFYLYALITAFFFGFIFKPLLASFNLFESYKWVNFPFIFLIYVVLFLIGYWITKFFLRMHHTTRDSSSVL